MGKYSARNIGRMAGVGIAKAFGGGKKAQRRVGYAAGLAGKYGSMAGLTAAKGAVGATLGATAAALTPSILGLGAIGLARASTASMRGLNHALQGYKAGGMIRGIVDVDPHTRSNMAVHGYLRRKAGQFKKLKTVRAFVLKYGRENIASFKARHAPLYAAELAKEKAFHAPAVAVAAPRARRAAAAAVAAPAVEAVRRRSPRLAR